MDLYHGSDHIIEKPVWGYGRRDNDYGSGFYCTQIWEMAAEWAASSEYGGFVNCYSLDVEQFRILDLTSDEHHILNWLAILISNRKVRFSSPIEKKAADYVIKNYLIDTKGYDVIYGLRADDSYFSFVRAFMSNTITIEQLSIAMRLGMHGIQYMLKSKPAFSAVEFVGSSPIDGKEYYRKRITRDSMARSDFYTLMDSDDSEGHTIRDIMKGALSYEDLCLLSTISE